MNDLDEWVDNGYHESKKEDDMTDKQEDYENWRIEAFVYVGDVPARFELSGKPRDAVAMVRYFESIIEETGATPRDVSGGYKPATSVAGGPPQCPTHGRSKESRNGGYYCTARTDDGNYCKWTAD